MPDNEVDDWTAILAAPKQATEADEWASILSAPTPEARAAFDRSGAEAAGNPYSDSYQPPDAAPSRQPRNTPGPVFSPDVTNEDIAARTGGAHGATPKERLMRDVEAQRGAIQAQVEQDNARELPYAVQVGSRALGALEGGIQATAREWHDLINHRGNRDIQIGQRTPQPEYQPPYPITGGPAGAEIIRKAGSGVDPVTGFVADLAGLPPSLASPSAIVAMLITHAPTGELLGAFGGPMVRAVEAKLGPRVAAAVNAELSSAVRLGAFSGAQVAAQGGTGEEITGATGHGFLGGIAFGLPGVVKGITGKGIPQAFPERAPLTAKNLPPIEDANRPGPVETTPTESRGTQADNQPPDQAHQEAVARIQQDAYDRLQARRPTVPKEHADAITGFSRAVKDGQPAVAEDGTPLSPKLVEHIHKAADDLAAGKDPEPYPEEPQTLVEQARAVAEGRKPAMVVTPGATAPAVPEGMRSIEIGDETVIFNPALTVPAKIRRAFQQDRRGDVLGYGIADKPPIKDIIGAVTVLNRDGLEVQSVLTDQKSLQSVSDAARAMAEPGDTIKLETPLEVIKRRVEGETGGAKTQEDARALAERLTIGEVVPQSPTKANEGQRKPFTRKEMAATPNVAGGISSAVRGSGLKPAFIDRETGKVYPSMYPPNYANKGDPARPAPVHSLDGLPNEVVLKSKQEGHDWEAPTVIEAKGSIEAGFVDDGGKFYSREEAHKIATSKPTERAPEPRPGGAVAATRGGGRGFQDSNDLGKSVRNPQNRTLDVPERAPEPRPAEPAPAPAGATRGKEEAPQGQEGLLDTDAGRTSPGDRTTPAPTETGAGGSRQPWEMTASEVAQARIESGELGKSGARRLRNAMSRGDVGAEMKRMDAGDTGRESPNHGHWLAVKRALADGEPVPPEVLADYPDLRAEAAKPEPSPQPRNPPPAVDPAPAPREGAKAEAGKGGDGAGTHERKPTKPKGDKEPPDFTARRATEATDEPGPVTSARNAMMAEDRAAMGLDALDGPERRSWASALDTAVSRGLPEKALDLAADIHNRPRPLTDIETAGMVHKANALKNEHRAVLAELEATKDPAEIQDRAARMQRIQDQFDSLTTALKETGTEQGRALASRRLTLDQDFSLVAMKARAKAAKGADLTAAESAKLTEAAKSMEDVVKRFEAMEKRDAETRAERTIKRESGRRRADPKAREAEFSTLLAKAKSLLEQGCA